MARDAAWLDGRQGRIPWLPDGIPAWRARKPASDAGTFWFALGLAAEGLGMGVVDEAFAMKRSRLAFLGSKKPKLCRASILAAISTAVQADASALAPATQAAAEAAAAAHEIAFVPRLCGERRFAAGQTCQPSETPAG